MSEERNHYVYYWVEDQPRIQCTVCQATHTSIYAKWIKHGILSRDPLNHKFELEDLPPGTRKLTEQSAIAFWHRFDSKPTTFRPSTSDVPNFGQIAKPTHTPSRQSFEPEFEGSEVKRGRPKLEDNEAWDVLNPDAAFPWQIEKPVKKQKQLSFQPKEKPVKNVDLGEDFFKF